MAVFEYCFSDIYVGLILDTSLNLKDVFQVKLVCPVPYWLSSFTYLGINVTNVCPFSHRNKTKH